MTKILSCYMAAGNKKESSKPTYITRCLPAADVVYIGPGTDP
jgi:hypothetical protein